MTGSKKVAILGTGSLSQSLAYRLVTSGYHVTMGSRDPSKQKLIALEDSIRKEISVVTVKNCLAQQEINVIFLAVHHRNVASILTPFRSLLNGKILVDTSNRTNTCHTGSNAEELASHFPEARIVKGLNTLSANALQPETMVESLIRVPLAADDVSAREAVACLVRDMGFCPVHKGGLQIARQIESYPLQLLFGWGRPTVISSGIFLVWLAIMVIKYTVKYSREDEKTFPWSRVPLTLLNILVCLTAITLLAVTYLPGCLAAFLQLYNGTKYKLFPSWLDLWLKSRKMLGLFALLFSIWHAIMSIAFLSPGSLKWWYEPVGQPITNSTNYHSTYRLNAIGESAITLGAMSLLLLGLIGLSSLPSVSAVLNWSEWRFVQSHLGYTALFLAVSHVFVMSFRGWQKYPSSFYYWNSFLCSILPSLVIVMKLFLTLPCISHRVSLIRDGYQRRSSVKQAKENKAVEIELLENSTV